MTFARIYSDVGCILPVTIILFLSNGLQCLKAKEQDGIIVPTEHSNEAVDFHPNAAYGEISPSVAS